MQGRFECVKGDPGVIENILGELFSTSMQSVPDSLEKATLIKIWQGDLLLKEAALPSSHVAYTLFYLKRALLQYAKCVWKGGLQSSLRSSQNSALPKDNDNGNSSVVQQCPVSRMMSNSELSTNCNDNNLGILSVYGDSPVSPTRRSVSLTSPLPPHVQPTIIAHSSAIHVSESSTQTRPHEGSESKTIPGDIFKKLVGEMCLEGGWGMCAHACVVGGILGALGGYNRLPHDWLKQLAPANQRYLNAKVNLLLDMFGLP